MKKITVSIALLFSLGLTNNSQAQTFTEFKESVIENRIVKGEEKRLHWVWTVMSVSGPLLDGFSTMYAINGSGDRIKVSEGNRFYHKLFGSNVTANEILMFKIGQATLYGLSTHYVGKHLKDADMREQIIGGTLIQFATHAIVSGFNVKNGLKARRINASISW